MKKGVRTALIVILAVILIISVIGLICKGAESWWRQQDIKDAQDIVTPKPTDTEPEPTVSDPQPTDTQPEPTDTEPAPTDTDPEPTDTEPEPTDTNVINLADLTLSEIRAINPDVVGWIQIPGTPVDYPLLQGADNDFYLDHSWRKTYNSGGSIFMECQNSRNLTDFNTIIYGHRMTDSSMFNCLRHYDSQSYWEQHPTVYIRTEQNVYTYRIFSACQVHVTDPVYWLITTQNSFKKTMINFCLENSAIQSDIVPTADDRIITLSTCINMGTSDYRWVVVAVLTGCTPAS